MERPPANGQGDRTLSARRDRAPVLLLLAHEYEIPAFVAGEAEIGVFRRLGRGDYHGLARLDTPWFCKALDIPAIQAYLPARQSTSRSARRPARSIWMGRTRP